MGKIWTLVTAMVLAVVVGMVALTGGAEANPGREEFAEVVNSHSKAERTYMCPDDGQNVCATPTGLRQSGVTWEVRFISTYNNKISAYQQKSTSPSLYDNGVLPEYDCHGSGYIAHKNDEHNGRRRAHCVLASEGPYEARTFFLKLPELVHADNTSIGVMVGDHKWVPFNVKWYDAQADKGDWCRDYYEFIGKPVGNRCTGLYRSKYVWGR